MRMSTFRYAPAGWRFWFGALAVVLIAGILIYGTLIVLNILGAVWMALGGS